MRILSTFLAMVLSMSAMAAEVTTTTVVRDTPKRDKPFSTGDCTIDAEVTLKGSLYHSQYTLDNGMSRKTDYGSLKGGILFVLGNFELGPIAQLQQAKQKTFEGDSVSLSGKGLGVRGKVNFTDIQKSMIVPYVAAEWVWSELDRTGYDRTRQQGMASVGVLFFMGSTVGVDLELGYTKAWPTEWNSDTSSYDHNTVERLGLGLGFSVFI